MARRRNISHKDIAGRIEGTVSGIQPITSPNSEDRKAVRELIVVLEDRRALYYPEHMEFGPWVQQSVQEIRGELTETLRKATEGAALIEPVRAMRAACRKYLDTLGHPGVPHRMPYHAEAVWWQALGELRGVFGRQLALLAVMYSADLPLCFDDIMPVADEEVA